ncbi:MAG: hypothetical protein ACD_3C00223G0029 [uncultured bacterium (gcode 4)]|uniref:Uncharacterized protein n=1 Tax=uncultured bacterium (gcode 4) TaxID=1234023 RepID=K2FZJ5_9BACT|nr:MAG: hypothetical protein ACD_3C00223G0029 [uncultured bacterium (gcode 4)]
MSPFAIAFLIVYPIFLIGMYNIFLLMAKRLHKQNMERLSQSSHLILEENFKRMVHYIRISLISLFVASVIFLFLILL